MEVQVLQVAQLIGSQELVSLCGWVLLFSVLNHRFGPDKLTDQTMPEDQAGIKRFGEDVRKAGSSG
jgi:hypothetical protein